MSVAELSDRNLRRALRLLLDAADAAVLADRNIAGVRVDLAPDEPEEL